MKTEPEAPRDGVELTDSTILAMISLRSADGLSRADLALEVGKYVQSELLRRIASRPQPAAPGAVDAAAITRALDAQPYVAVNGPMRVWQFFEPAADARKVMAAALNAAGMGQSADIIAKVENLAESDWIEIFAHRPDIETRLCAILSKDAQPIDPAAKLYASAPPVTEDTARLDWLDAQEADVRFHRDHNLADDGEYLIMVQIVKGDKSISGHPLGYIREAIDAARLTGAHTDGR